ncbi:MAG: hypothetical protein ACI9EF_002937 [Pseudohongiellaceae bacterium]|jgi:hypothetical protein
MGPALLTTVALLLCSGLSSAQVQTDGPVSCPLPPTRLAQGLLSQEPIVAQVMTESITAFGMGTVVVRARIDELISAPALQPEVAVGDSVVLFAFVDRYPTSGKALVYLSPFRRGGRYELLEVVDGRDINWKAKLEMTRATVALLSITSRQGQAAATFDLLARSLMSSNSWVRRYALRELEWMAAQQSWVITQARLRRLRSLSARSAHPEVPNGVERVAMTLEAATRPLPPQDSEESSRS